MGLAASQARFLGLTARKSNTEYEGQQVNQQRTALANESASLYNQLTNLSVPTPPDITNYYKTEYTFAYNGDTFTMTTLPIKEDGGYTVSVASVNEVPGYKAIDREALGFDPAAVEEPAKITLADRPELVKHMAAIGKDTSDTTQNINVFSNNNNWYYQVGEDFYQYTPNQMVTTNVYTGVQLTFNEAGDFDTISHQDLTNGQKISVSTNQVADDEAYDLAMYNYTKEKDEYEKTMARINAKTEVLQQQDKTLELRLNQLDTEQNAISTEMDAVQKVIEKNVESTFKTFA